MTNSRLIKRVHPNVNVISTELHNQELVLLHIQSGEYYTLNATGAEIWQELQKQPDLDVVSQRLAVRHALTAATADSYVQELVAALAADQLVTVIETSRETPNQQS
jgi:hypothetical protein